MNSKRNFLKSTSIGVWSSPIIVSVVLPAHAEMSGMNWNFNIVFIENCMNCNTDFGDMEGELIRLDPPQEEQLIFEVFEDELENGEFSKTFDLDGFGPISDFFSYAFSVLDLTTNIISGTVERSSVDVPDLLRGTFEAKKI